jgi:hypothetical protein
VSFGKAASRLKHTVGQLGHCIEELTVKAKMIWSVVLSVLLVVAIFAFLYLTINVKWWLGMSKVVIAALTIFSLAPIFWAKIKKFKGILTVLFLATYTTLIIAFFWLTPAGITDDNHLSFLAILAIVFHLIESEKWWPWQWLKRK